MTLQGIDISSWQAGINLAAVPCDFVIVKATEGVGYVSPTWGEQINATLSLGKKAGAYHYANGYAATTEADLFLTQFSPYIGRAIPILDWESGGNMQWGNGNWVRDWVTHVHNRTGVWPLVYVQSSAISQIPGDVQATCGLWVAQYADMNPTGYQDTPWNEGAYTCAMRQYSGTGTLPGYGGQLDLNKFYGDGAAWDAYAGGQAGGQSMSVAGDVWTYNWNNTARGGNCYNALMGAANDVGYVASYLRPRFLGAKDTDARLLWVPGQGVIPLYEPKEMAEIASDYKNIHGWDVPTVLFNTAKQMNYFISIITNKPHDERAKYRGK